MSRPFVTVSCFVMMRVSGLLVLAVLVLILHFENENEVNGYPVPDPCNIFLNRLRRPKTVTTTEPPKTEEQKIEESRKMIEQYRILFNNLLFGGSSTVKPQPAPRTIDTNSFFNSHIEFFTKFFNMI